MTSPTPILVVDDDEDILGALSDILGYAGYEVLTAQHGAQALDIISRERIRVILLDMKMPVMDGWAFAEAYRCRVNSQVPIVVLTAANEPARWAAEVQATAYLAKPFEMDDLLTLIESLVSG